MAKMIDLDTVADTLNDIVARASDADYDSVAGMQSALGDIARIAGDCLIDNNYVAIDTEAASE